MSDNYFVTLTPEQIAKKLDYIDSFVKSDAASADLIGLDPNSNVASSSMATLMSTINKDILIQLNRAEMFRKLEAKEEGLGQKYLDMIKSHLIYIHDETYMAPYCAAISLDPLLLDGTNSIGGTTDAPQHLNSFIGSFLQMVKIAAAELAGALATPDLFRYITKFAMDDYGADSFDWDNERWFYKDALLSEAEKTKRDACLNLKAVLLESFAQLVYDINQPCSGRNGQSIFFNVSMFDRYYYESMFPRDQQFYPYKKNKETKKPDPNNKGTQYVPYEQVNAVQRLFSEYLRKERKRKILTFPVVTAAVLNDGKGSVKDKDFVEFCAEQMAKGDSFFIYQSNTADSLASCCRLRNEVDKNDFSYSLGAGGIKTGSVKVMTINMNRLIQTNVDLGETVDLLHKFLITYRETIAEKIKYNKIEIYKAHYIDLSRQFCTIGINGMVEAAEFKGLTPDDNKEYNEFVDSLLDVISKKNKAMQAKTKIKFNTEFVPAENLGVKNATWDKADGLEVRRDCYNSYFYRVEDIDISPLEKFSLHGEKYTSKLDGGSALHLNLHEILDKDQVLKLFDIAAKTGCYYWCYNTPYTICNSCGEITRNMKDVCPKCNSDDVTYATRVIGYLRPIDTWSTERKEEFFRRNFHKTEQEV